MIVRQRGKAIGAGLRAGIAHVDEVDEHAVHAEFDGMLPLRNRRRVHQLYRLRVHRERHGAAAEGRRVRDAHRGRQPRTQFSLGRKRRPSEVGIVERVIAREVGRTQLVKPIAAARDAGPPQLIRGVNRVEALALRPRGEVCRRREVHILRIREGGIHRVVLRYAVVDLPHAEGVSQRRVDGAHVRRRQTDRGCRRGSDVVVLWLVLLGTFSGAEEERPVLHNPSAQ